ncbi:hypothetical protein C8R43DRAFT_960343 [Mycena crocata]|nr:hypothetical protein C8R43DRAFT_960343 [Mycena crocata]
MTARSKPHQYVSGTEVFTLAYSTYTTMHPTFNASDVFKLSTTRFDTSYSTSRHPLLRHGFYYSNDLAESFKSSSNDFNPVNATSLLHQCAPSQTLTSDLISHTLTPSIQFFISTAAISRHSYSVPCEHRLPHPSLESTASIPSTRILSPEKHSVITQKMPSNLSSCLKSDYNFVSTTYVPSGFRPIGQHTSDELLHNPLQTTVISVHF